MSMTETKTEPSPEECFSESAAALRDGNLDTADRWRQLGEAISAARR